MYSTTIVNSAEGLGQIIAVASKFGTDRFLYAMEYKDFDEREINSMGNEIATYRLKLETEYKRLYAFAQTFNKEFATDDNACFDSALILLRKLKGGIRETKRIFKKFCPRVRRDEIHRAISKRPGSAYEYSFLSSDTYQLRLFEFEGYPPCVAGLYHEMENFFMLLVKCLYLCIQVLKDEKLIKRDADYCNRLFLKFKDKFIKEFQGFFRMISRYDDELKEENNPAIASRSCCVNDEAWASESFHRYHKTDVQKLVVKQVLDKEAGSDLETDEILLFGKDTERVHRYRHIIQHFDALLPAGYNKKKLPAKYVQMFLQYVKIPEKHEKMAVEYFKRIYENAPNHLHEMVTYSAVNGSKKEVLADTDGEYRTFSMRIYNRLSSQYPTK